MEANVVNTLLSSLVDTIADAVVAKLASSDVLANAIDTQLEKTLETAINIVLNDREYNVREEIIEVIENMSFDVSVRSI